MNFLKYFQLSSFEFKFRIFSGPEEHIPAMRRVRNLVETANFKTGDKYVTVWGKIFANWVTDEVIFFTFLYSIFEAAFSRNCDVLIMEQPKPQEQSLPFNLTPLYVMMQTENNGNIICDLGCVNLTFSSNFNCHQF
jgi:hypothetical protein